MLGAGVMGSQSTAELGRGVIGVTKHCNVVIGVTKHCNVVIGVTRGHKALQCWEEGVIGVTKHCSAGEKVS